ncbi:MAG: DUF4954 family protein, partial [Calditrichaeota bacterium]
IRIFDRLSAQLAYIMIFYRHRPELIRRLESLIDQYVQTKRSSRGMVGKNCRIRHCGVIQNVTIGDSAEISGTLLLDNGAILSCTEAPVHIGAGVIAKRFIIQSGSSVKDGAQVNACFLGQSVQMGKQYSAENSLFFANSELFHGEGCSVFAGPYTVTHHKATLLIAGYYSFYNAGSGTNQSNHMYKLGPVHQGILERGAKTGSFSYLLWPTRVGAFTNVIGKHYVNFDASDLPFSFINEENGVSVIVPAMNLFTVGTKRDGLKWPARDGRKDSDKLDMINFAVLSPYTVGRMVRAAQKLRELAEQTPQKQESVSWNGLSINRLMLRTSAKYYELAIQIFIGDMIVGHLERFPDTVLWEDIAKDFEVPVDCLQEKWIDAAGMLVSSSRMEMFIRAMEAGAVNDLSEFERLLRELYSAHDRDALHWAISLAAARRQLKPSGLTREVLAELITEWKTSRLKLNNMILQDAGKEFSPSSMIGYGMDGSEAEKQADFAAVRGSFDSNSFVKGLKEESEAVEKRAARLIERVKEGVKR